MKYIKTNKNCDLLIAYGFIYLMHRILKTGSVSWGCCQTFCNGRIKMSNNNCEIVTSHSNAPDPAEVEKRRFRTALKNRAAGTDETPRQDVFNIQRTITRENPAAIPVYSANQRTITRVTQNTLHQMPEQTSLAGFKVSEALQHCPSGENYFYFDTVIADEDRISVFATLSAIDTLSEATHCF